MPHTNHIQLSMIFIHYGIYFPLIQNVFGKTIGALGSDWIRLDQRFSQTAYRLRDLHGVSQQLVEVFLELRRHLVVAPLHVRPDQVLIPQRNGWPFLAMVDGFKQEKNMED